MTAAHDLQIDIQAASGSVSLPDAAAIRCWVEAALRAGRHRNGEPRPEPDIATELSVRLVDEAESRELNHQYRGKDAPTNVLSFPAELPPGLPIDLLGDLVICAPVVEREARQQHKPIAAHWAHMVVHGTLHLLGYDHIDERDAEIMESLEIAILAGLDIANPYLDNLNLDNPNPCVDKEDSTQSHG